MHDVAIIGGGPAGSAAAIELSRQGRSVAMIERSRYEDPRVGETLAPGSRPLLERLGVMAQFEAQMHVPAPGVISAWGNDEPYVNDFIVNPYGNGWHVDRPRFDRLLATHARDCGTRVYEQARVVRCTESAGHWQLAVASARGDDIIRCRYLIDASGRRDSALKRRAGKRFLYDNLVGLVAFMPVDAGIDGHTLIESVSDGWWYSALLPDDRCVVTFMTDADLAATGRGNVAEFFLQHLRRSVLTARRVNATARDCAVSIAPAMSYRHARPNGNNWLLAGDAAVTRDPLSGQGVCTAIESGLAAAAAIHRALNGEGTSLAQYSSALNSAHDRYLDVRRNFYRAEQRWPASPFWRRRHQPH